MSGEDIGEVWEEPETWLREDEYRDDDEFVFRGMYVGGTIMYKLVLYAYIPYALEYSFIYRIRTINYDTAVYM